MTPSQQTHASRRAVLAALLGTTAGCSALDGESTTRTATDAAAVGGESGTRTTTDTAATDAPGTDAPPAEDRAAVHVEATSALFPAVRRAATAWNRNARPSQWQWGDGSAVETDRRLADHFASERGLDPTSEPSSPPFLMAVSWADADGVAAALADERIDVGSTGIEPLAETGIESPDEIAERTVARWGSAVFVSPAIAAAGVTTLTAAAVRDVYAGRIENWRALGGPDRDIHVVTLPAGSPPAHLEQTFLRGVPDDGVDVRIGRAAERHRLIESREDAFGFAGVGLADGRVPALEIDVDGTRYGVREAGYPTTETVRCQTLGAPEPREAAVIDFLQSPVGRALFEPEPRLVAAE